VKINFTPEVLRDLKEHICKTLKDTFHIMFGLEIVLSPAPSEKIHEEKGYTAYAELYNATNRTFLAVTIPYDVAEKSLISLKNNPEGASPEMMQDMANEVTNVIVHAIRAYLIFSQGVTLDVKTSSSSPPNMNDPNMDVESLYFLVKSGEMVDVDFSYPKV